MNKSEIQTKHGSITLPAFMPDATYGSIKALSFLDAKKSGIKEIVTTTLHIEQKIGSKYIKEFGGIHKFFGWDRPILTDSGGWQVFSLINSKKTVDGRQFTVDSGQKTVDGLRTTDHGKRKTENRITEAGCSFIDPNTGLHSLLTPESSQTIQHNLGSDIVTVLDNPILGNASYKERKECVRINSVWAKRSLNKFLELNEIQSLNSTKDRSLIGAVIQGGNDFELRKISADQLLEMDFDIYNFGGMPLHTGVTWLTESPKGFYHEMLEYVSKLIPNTKLKYAMGVGQPEDIAFCVDAGWDLFDTVLPTRNARHGFLYVSEGQGEVSKGYKNLNYDTVHIRAERYKLDNKPLDENCDCECCTTISRAYLRHLIRIGEASGYRLATIHNLRFYAKWLRAIQVKVKK